MIVLMEGAEGRDQITYPKISIFYNIFKGINAARSLYPIKKGWQPGQP